MNIIEVILNNPVRLAIISLLNTVIIDNSFIFLSLWSIGHLFLGGIITYILFNTKVQRERILIYLFIILFSYEIIEYMLYTFTSLFLQESSLDVIWDMIIGMLGGTIIFLSKRNKSDTNAKRNTQNI